MALISGQASGITYGKRRKRRYGPTVEAMAQYLPYLAGQSQEQEFREKQLAQSKEQAAETLGFERERLTTDVGMRKAEIERQDISDRLARESRERLAAAEKRRAGEAFELQKKQGTQATVIGAGGLALKGYLGYKGLPAATQTGIKSFLGFEGTPAVSGPTTGAGSMQGMTAEGMLVGPKVSPYSGAFTGALVGGGLAVGARALGASKKASTALGVGGGIMAGAAKGAMGGPWGAVIGGFIGGVAGLIGARCIIISACTSEDSYEVEISREYRDKYMDMPTLVGYYAFASKVAPYIHKYPIIKRLTKKFLVDRMVDYGEWFLRYKTKRKFRSSWWVTMGFLGLCRTIGMFKRSLAWQTRY